MKNYLESSVNTYFIQIFISSKCWCKHHYVASTCLGFSPGNSFVEQKNEGRLPLAGTKLHHVPQPFLGNKFTNAGITSLLRKYKYSSPVTVQSMKNVTTTDIHPNIHFQRKLLMILLRPPVWISERLFRTILAINCTIETKCSLV